MKKRTLAAACLFALSTFAQTTKLDISESDASALRKLAAEKDFSGTVLVIKDGKPLLTINQGKSSENNSVPFSPDVRMNTCSNGKSMTAVLIQQLIAKEILQPDQTLRQLLPEENLLNADSITLQHLLTHTSGLGDFFDHPDYSKANPVTTDDFMKLIREQPAAHNEPGKKFAYSNAGYIVLGKILEDHYKMPYQQIVKIKILLPLGIDTSSQGHVYAKGYFKSDNHWVVGDGNDPNRWSAAGGLYLSANEWHLFAQSLAEEKLLDRKSLDAVWTRYSRPDKNPEFVGYGRGFMIESPANLTFIGHNGGIKGFQSAYRYVPQADMYIYVFSNHDGSAEEVFMTLLRGFIKQKMEQDEEKKRG